MFLRDWNEVFQKDNITQQQASNLTDTSMMHIYTEGAFPKGGDSANVRAWDETLGQMRSACQCIHSIK